MFGRKDKSEFLELSSTEPSDKLKRPLKGLIEGIYKSNKQYIDVNNITVEYLTPRDMYFFLENLTLGRRRRFIGKEKVLDQSGSYFMGASKFQMRDKINYGYLMNTPDYFIFREDISGIELLVLNIDALESSNYHITSVNPKARSIIIANSSHNFKGALEEQLKNLPKRLGKGRLKSEKLYKQLRRSDYNCC